MKHDYLDSRLSELRVALSSTKALLTSSTETFKGDEVLKQACRKYIEEIERLEKLKVSENKEIN